MNKKFYEIPEFEIIELNLEAPLLTESNGEAEYNPGDSQPGTPGTTY